MASCLKEAKSQPGNLKLVDQILYTLCITLIDSLTVFVTDTVKEEAVFEAPINIPGWRWRP